MKSRKKKLKISPLSLFVSFRSVCSPSGPVALHKQSLSSHVTAIAGGNGRWHLWSANVISNHLCMVLLFFYGKSFMCSWWTKQHQKASSYMLCLCSSLCFCAAIGDRLTSIDTLIYWAISWVMCLMPAPACKDGAMADVPTPNVVAHMITLTTLTASNS